MANEGKANKKWSDHAERDLCIAIMTSLMPEKPKYDWAKVVEVMHSLGHDFTKDAISQHWTKTIMKEFKARHGNNALNRGEPSQSTPTATPKKPRTPASKRKTIAADMGDEETPTKKSKKTPNVKKEAKQEIEDDMILTNGDEARFNAWVDASF